MVPRWKRPRIGQLLPLPTGRGLSGGNVQSCDRRDEPVSPTRNGFDERGSIGGIAEGEAEFLDRSVEALVEVDASSVRPQAGAQFFAADRLTWPLEQYGQDLERLILQMENGAAVVEYACRKICLKQPKTKAPGPIGWGLHMERHLKNMPESLSLQKMRVLLSSANPTTP
jgi:hypothetical protein